MVQVSSPAWASRGRHGAYAVPLSLGLGCRKVKISLVGGGCLSWVFDELRVRRRDSHCQKSQSRVSLQSPHRPSIHKYTCHHQCSAAATLHEPRLLHVSVDRSEKA